MHHSTWISLRTFAFTLVIAGSSLIGQAAAAKVRRHHIPELGNASYIVMPQTRSFSIDRHAPSVVIEKVKADVSIVQQAARTTLDIALRNQSSSRAEAVLLLPVPDDAAVSGFAFEGAASEPTAQLLRADEARKLYNSIVAQIRDPALLEFAGYNLIRSSVFPVPPNGTQRVKLTYEHILPADSERIDYVLPRSESLSRQSPWSISVDLRTKSPISTIYSPTHDLETKIVSPTHQQVRVTDTSASDPGPFRLSYLLERNGVTASLIAYPDPEVGGGYFLLMAGLPASIKDSPQTIRREVTLVLDRSGSMAGGKLDQVKVAAMQVIEGLEDGESFNIIDYATDVQTFASQPVVRSEQAIQQARHYINTLRPGGGTNIYDALLESLRQQPTQGALPLVLFLTDGLPTIGPRNSEAAIRELAEKNNPFKRRIFTFGVGADVNAPLLDRVSDITRAIATYVLPDEDVELKVASVFKRLYGPVLADLSLKTLNSSGDASTRLVRDLVPATIPDVYEGDQLILMGTYLNDQPITFQLAGSFLGKQRTFSFNFDFDSATTRNAFVPRLWAARRIAYLVDEIRQAGALPTGAPPSSMQHVLNDPKYKELVDEILMLSTKFGVLSEYTAFLATEGTNLGEWDDLLTACNDNLARRALSARTGEAGVNQAINFNAQKSQSKLSYRNEFMDAELEVVRYATVQQINDGALFNQRGQWIDSRLIRKSNSPTPTRTIEFGSEEHMDLVYQFAADNRQGMLSMPGDVLLLVNGECVLVHNDIN